MFLLLDLWSAYSASGSDLPGSSEAAPHENSQRLIEIVFGVNGILVYDLSA